jgi:hypothetical protein
MNSPKAAEFVRGQPRCILVWFGYQDVGGAPTRTHDAFLRRR